jgi:hypothetical protein
MSTRRYALLVLAAAALGGLLHACSNSLLRNFTEAGLETALDDPLPTPTAKARR